MLAAALLVLVLLAALLILLALLLAGLLARLLLLLALRILLASLVVLVGHVILRGWIASPLVRTGSLRGRFRKNPRVPWVSLCFFRHLPKCAARPTSRLQHASG